MMRCFVKQFTIFISDDQITAYFVTYFMRPDFLLAFWKLANGRDKNKRGISVSRLEDKIIGR